MTDAKSSSATDQRVSRRTFTKTAGTAVAAFGVNYIPAHAFGKLEKPALGGIGAGGKGATDIRQSDEVGFDIAALVDVVDATKLATIEGKKQRSMAEVRSSYPNARFFNDYREMIAEMGDKIDAVTVSTPDHHHYHASALAMNSGKHVYCQKPLTHGIWEARMLAQLARESGVKTQMGNQAHANDHMRRCVELIRAGVIGKVKEIHAWTNRPIWPQGFQTPPPKETVPAAIDWNQWVGPAPWVDYSSKIAPFAWRGWWNYGTGALGDMACHIMDMGYWAMGLPTPSSVVAKQEGASDYSPPINSIITWQFPQNEYSSNKGFKYHWYDGYVDATFDREGWKLIKNGDEYNHPSDKMLEGLSFKDYGSIIVGEHGKLFFHRAKNRWVVKPSNILDGFKWPEQSIPRANGQNNYQEWLDAINGVVDQSQSHFGHAGPMTETILLGVIAQRFAGQKLEWNADTMEIDGRPELKQYIQREYREGWNLKA